MGTHIRFIEHVYVEESLSECCEPGRRTGCVTRPDPRFENQITTYISQEEEELEVAGWSPR